jgi:hypothetical protein
VLQEGLLWASWSGTIAARCSCGVPRCRKSSYALSKAEAEYYSVLEMAIKMIFLCNSLANLGLQQEVYKEMFEDSTACIKWSNHVLCAESAAGIGQSTGTLTSASTLLTREAVQNGHIWLYQI